MRCALHNCEGAKPIEERKGKKEKRWYLEIVGAFVWRVCVSVCVFRVNIERILERTVERVDLH